MLPGFGNLMAKAQYIRHMPSRGMQSGFKSKPSSAFVSSNTSLKIFDPSRSGLTRLHRKVKTKDPEKKVQDNLTEIKTADTFPNAEWKKLSEALNEFKKKISSPRANHFEKAVSDLELKPATESRISDLLRPAALTKALRETFLSRNYRDVAMGKVLANKLNELFGKSVDGQKKKKPVFDKRDLAKKISFKKEDGEIQDINVLDWLETLFKESAPKKRFKHHIHQIEASINDFNSPSSDEEVLRIKSTYGQGRFFELRAELAFEYLKAKGEIINYKRTVANSYLDHLGIDFLVRAKIKGQAKILAVQVKSSQSCAKDFYKAKQLSMYNFRQRQPLDTLNQRKGILLLNMQKQTLSNLADKVSKIITNDEARAEAKVALIPDFDFVNNVDLEKLKAWYNSLEENLVENYKELTQEQVA
jgi:hypothetical protein